MILAAAASRFAAGEIVLVGDETDEAIFLAAAAESITSGALAELSDVSRGAVVLGVSEQVVERLGLAAPGRGGPESEALRMVAPIDATGGRGWSLGDRAHTMRVAARAESQPRDLVVPGHVLTAQIGEDVAGAPAGALELVRMTDHGDAVALAAVVDRTGRLAVLGDAVQDARLRRVPHVSSAELRSHAISRATAELAVRCELPTRDGRFRALAFESRASGQATIALIHGEPAGHPSPVVHLHVACRMGDVFGSLLCSCRAELDAAVEEIIATGCGIVVYAQPADPGKTSCPRAEQIDVALVIGMLRAAGVQSLLPSPRVRELTTELRGRGLEVAA
jgi:3,4-dihydroxy 2-butanone 4-phosphate synthase/GTP cyclohydrolase II